MSICLSLSLLCFCRRKIASWSNISNWYAEARHILYISDFVMEFKYLRRWHIAVVILYILACGWYSVNEKEESAVYVSSERAELKGHFVCGILPRCFRRRTSRVHQSVTGRVTNKRMVQLSRKQRVCTCAKYNGEPHHGPVAPTDA